MSWWVVELRRLAAREDLLEPAEQLIAGLRLMALDRASLDRASRLDPLQVRTLDAIHLDAAVALERDDEIAAVLTYDRQLQTGCAHHGLDVEAPTAG